MTKETNFHISGKELRKMEASRQLRISKEKLQEFINALYFLKIHPREAIESSEKRKTLDELAHYLIQLHEFIG